MITAEVVRNTIDTAGEDFQRCWSFMSPPKKDVGSAITAEGIFDFQVRLFNSLDKLGGLYRRIRVEEKRLITAKSTYSARWFAQYMKRLKGFRISILEAMAVGRAIGDGFAWMFYRNSRNLIDEHLALQRQKFIPEKVGGVGEKIFIDKIKKIGDHFILCHGITTFLRLGDVSFVDLRTGAVSSIGEIKTKKVGEDEYQLNLSIIAGDPEGMPKISASAAKHPAPQIDQTTKAKLERQIRKMSEAVKQAKDGRRGERVQRPGAFHHDKLAQLVKDSGAERMTCIQVDRGLLICALRISDDRSLASGILAKGRSFKRRMSEAPQMALQIIDKDTKENSLLLGSIGSGEYELSLSREGLPFFWWPLPRRIIEDILFRRVLVITMFNPVFLWNDLRARGFELKTDGKAEIPSATMMIGDKRVELTRFDYYYRLITHSLMAEKCVMELVDTFLKVAEEKGREGYQRIEMNPRVTLGPDPDLPILS